MKSFTPLLLVVFLLDCGQGTNHEDTYNHELPLLEYVEEFSEDVSVKAFYAEEAPDWKFELKIEKDNQVIFEANPLLEYEFKEQSFPTYVSVDSFEYILIERNDRPLKSKVDVFRINSDKVDSVFSIPYFYQQGLDIDNDNIEEYYSALESNQTSQYQSISYNPILVYEITPDKFNFDSLATILLNEQVYGQFYGFSVIDTLSFDVDLIESRLSVVGH